METWFKIECPHCGSRNWINRGDMSDMTAPDVEACKCWQCEKKFLLPGIEDEICAGEDEEYRDVDHYLEEGAMCEWGRRNPDDPYRLC